MNVYKIEYQGQFSYNPRPVQYLVADSYTNAEKTFREYHHDCTIYNIEMVGENVLIQQIK